MIGQSAEKTRSTAYLLGVYLGDGWMGKTTNNRWDFRLNSIDRDFCESTMDCFNSVLGRRTKIHVHSVSKSDKPNHSLTIGCKDLFWFIDATDKKEKIPEYVWRLKRDDKISFIAGIMDSEGYVAKDRNNRIMIGIKATQNWIKDFYRLVRSLDLKTGGLLSEKIKSGKTAYYFRFNVKSWIDSGCYFNISRKQKRVDSYSQRLHVEHRKVKI